MAFNVHILETVFLITGVLFFVGAPLKIRFPQIPYFCLPTIGLVIYGGFVVPLLYLTGGWHPLILYATVALLLLLGLVSLTYLLFKSRPRQKVNLFSLLVTLLFLLITIGFVSQASQYSLPGGIDPAFHAAFMNNIVQSNNFDTSYPLGMHTLMLSIVNATPFSTPSVFLAFSIFLIFNIFTLTFLILKKLSSNILSPIIGVCLVILDVSIFNNYLNGSITHLVAILIILSGIALTLFLPSNSRYLTFACLTAFYVFIFYFHFITLFVLAPVLWLLRIQRNQSTQWEILAAFLASIIIAIPVLKNFINVTDFQTQFLAASILFALVEVGIIFFRVSIRRVIYNPWVQFVAASAGLLFFYNTFGVFDKIPDWYGPFTILWVAVGVLTITIFKQQQWYPIVTYFTVLSSFYYLIGLASDRVNLDLFKQMLFYFGFTVPLVLLGAAGISLSLQKLQNKIAQTFAVAILFVFVALIFFSRISDRILVSDAHIVSRYGKNDGFNLFYTQDDVKVAEWVKGNTQKGAGIVNPGGLYNAWASISQRRTMYARTEAGTLEPEATHQVVADLLNNHSLSCPHKLLAHGYDYLLMPSQYVVRFWNPCLTLVHASGEARLYKIHEQPLNSTQSYGVNFSNLTSQNAITISGNFQVHCKYCDNKFYYQFKEIGKVVRVPVHGKIQVEIAAPSQDRFINLIIGDQNFSLTAKMVEPTNEKIEFSNEYLLQRYVQKKGEVTKIELSNKTRNFAQVDMIILETL